MPTVTLFWKDRYTTEVDEDGTERKVPVPPVQQEIMGYYPAGGAIILVESKETEYIFPFSELECITVNYETEAADAGADEPESVRETPDPEDSGGSIITLPTRGSKES